MFIVNSLIEKQLQLDREEFVRPHGFGGQWKKLRIALLWSLNGGSGLLTGASAGITNLATKQTFFFIGVCQGVNGGYTNPAGTPDCLVVSPWSVASLGTPMIYQNLPPIYFTISFNPARYIWKTGTTENITTLGSSGAFGSVSPIRSQFYVDITLNDNNTATITPFMPASSSSATTDINPVRFMQTLEIESPVDVTHGLSAYSSATIAYTGNSQLDCVSIFWKRSTPCFNVSELCAIRIY